MCSKISLDLNKIEDLENIVRELKYKEGIPKIIHQTYMREEKLSREIQLNIRYLKKMNPDWEYRFYDDNDIEEYIQKNFPEVLSYYLSINYKYGAARADLFRYLVLYNEGGVYLDIKSTFIKTLSNSIQEKDTYLLSFWNKDNWGIHPEIKSKFGEFQQCFIVSSKGHPFLKHVINMVLRNIKVSKDKTHIFGKYGTLRLTGPIAYTLAITPILNKYRYRLIKSYKDLGYIYSIYDRFYNKSYKTLFPEHYEQQFEPIVLCNK